MLVHDLLVFGRRQGLGLGLGDLRWWLRHEYALSVGHLLLPHHSLLCLLHNLILLYHLLSGRLRIKVGMRLLIEVLAIVHRLDRCRILIGRSQRLCRRLDCIKIGVEVGHRCRSQRRQLLVRPLGPLTQPLNVLKDDLLLIYYDGRRIIRHQLLFEVCHILCDIHLEGVGLWWQVQRWQTLVPSKTVLPVQSGARIAGCN